MQTILDKQFSRAAMAMPVICENRRARVPVSLRFRRISYTHSRTRRVFEFPTTRQSFKVVFVGRSSVSASHVWISQEKTLCRVAFVGPPDACKVAEKHVQMIRKRAGDADPILCDTHVRDRKTITYSRTYCVI